VFYILTFLSTVHLWHRRFESWPLTLFEISGVVAKER